MGSCICDDKPDGLRKFVIALKYVYYKFGCLVYVFRCGLVGGTEVVQ